MLSHFSSSFDWVDISWSGKWNSYNGMLLGCWVLESTPNFVTSSLYYFYAVFMLPVRGPEYRLLVCSLFKSEQCIAVKRTSAYVYCCIYYDLAVCHFAA
jgi:hypothetical protein